MKHNYFKFSALLFLGLKLTAMNAQRSIPASGGEASGNGGSVSYTVGQAVYTANTGVNGSMTQGVQQPYEISVVAGLEDTNEIDLTFYVYPNPITENVKLKVENYKSTDLSYQLFDISGKLLENKKIEASETSIAMNTFIKATYFLKVTDNNKAVKTFKIIKN